MVNDSANATLSKQGLKILLCFCETKNRSLAGADVLRETGISTGTLYPLLHKLKNQGLLKSEKETGDPRELGRPLRTFYSITSDGVRAVERELSELRVIKTGLTLAGT